MAYAPDGTFNAVDRERAVSAGRAGGQSTSAAKVSAAKRNGQNGGRPTSRTLIERILNRPVTPRRWSMIQEKVLSRILLREQQIIPDFFGVNWTDVPRKSWRSIPPHVRQMMRHVKALALIYGRWPKWGTPTFTVLSKNESHAAWLADYMRRERASIAHTAWKASRKKARRPRRAKS